eukprot:TRINITY_DN4162_c0_g3_i1.p1 TRINITY_DN4162_c0_g3~~TRINITY_DN4162_c0_g3_i1.p1  ORF type:complete len:863 (-),score=189.38 TRINITY_DN4162_c0_g3_i1:59-2647(-)
MVFKQVQSLPFPPLSVSIDSYQHSSGLMLHVAPIKGPISHAYIVVPTETFNDMGLPHTLEHLIFLGSKNNPYRGYLDQVAARCLTTGTNAYTMDDHTCYYITTAGQQGLLTILPLLLDYVLHPTLTDENFVTEIYHIDGEGREQGVVYCEMLGRENTEKDLLDLNVNAVLFPNTGYSKASGGLTPDIAKLDNNMIRDYHKSMYHPSNMSIVLLGQIDVKKVFQCLDKVSIASPDIPFTLPWTDPIPPLLEDVSKVCTFPSEDSSVGTVCLGWRGPTIDDFKTIAALCVLFRYLHETSASPIQRRFVEREDPLASSAYFSIKNSKITGIVLEFTGVPTNRDSDEDSESGDSDESDSEDESDEEDDEESEGDESDSDDENDLYVPNSIKKRLMKLLVKIRDNGFSEGPDIINKTILREGVKFLESIEDDPSEAILGLLFPDLIFPGNRLPTQRVQQQEIFQELLSKPTQFWLDLLDKWLIKQPIVEVIMKPDTEMAKKMTEETQRKISERVEKLGPVELQKLKTRLEECIKENHKPIPDTIVFPDIPSPSTIPILPVESTIFLPVANASSSKKAQKSERLEKIPHFYFSEGLTNFPFPVQLVNVETQFVHFKIIFDISNLPVELRPYLVLFQELILETALELPGDKKPIFVPHTEVALQLNSQVVSVENGVGFDNRGFSASCIPDLFYFYFLSEKDKVDQVCSWIIKILFYTVFPKSRISSMVSNLLSDVSEDLRDANAVLGALYAFALEPTHTKNEVAISTFTQKKFLTKIKKGLKSNNTQSNTKKSRGKKKMQRVVVDELSETEVRENLEKIRTYLLADEGRVFAQISKPFDVASPLRQLQEHWKKAIHIRTHPKIQNNNNN